MSAIDIQAALEAVRLGEATQAHAAVLASAIEGREADVHARVRAGYDRTIADTWRAEVERRDAELATARAERDQAQRLLDRARDERDAYREQRDRVCSERDLLLVEAADARAERDAALEEQRRAVARLAEVSAERDRLMAAAVAQAEAWDAADARCSQVTERALRDGDWQAATSATEALGRELRGAR